MLLVEHLGPAPTFRLNDLGHPIPDTDQVPPEILDASKSPVVSHYPAGCLPKETEIALIVASDLPVGLVALKISIKSKLVPLGDGQAFPFLTR